MMATVYTIPSGVAFIDALARGLLHKYKDNPIGLSQLEIYLPNRRSCRSVSESFLKLTDGSVTILPRLTPIGDIDQDELLLNDMMPDLSVTEPIQPLARQFLLAQLIMARGDLDLSHDQAIRLATDLGRLIDQIHAYDLSPDTLKNLVPDEFAEHWKITINFLSIIIKTLPTILKERAVCNPSEYRNELLGLKSDIFKRTPPSHPIIAAGATGSIPATAKFLSAIAHLPTGCVILPGLDHHLDDEGWETLEETHPQFALKNLLSVIDIERSNVEIWPSLIEDESRSPKTIAILQAREKLMSEMVRPASTTQQWNSISLNPICIDGVTQIDTQSPQEEAQTIALMMREVLETPKKTALLITPDRGLAQRVAADLKRWNVDIDDSAGQALSQTSLGYFLTLTAMMMSPNHHTVTLLEMLKHPLCHMGYDRTDYIRHITALEKHIIRGPKLNGFDAIIAKIDALENEETRTHLIDFAQKLATVFTPIWALETPPLNEWITAHLTLAHELANGADNLWHDDDGEAAATLLTDLTHGIEWQPDMPVDDYAALLTTLMDQVTIRPKYQRHPRLKILSPIEGQLQSADLIILGGLNEGIWPMGSINDPWMSRPMREQFGLPGLDRQIGLSAHNFCQHFCAPDVVLTRSKMSGGAQTVPSRWLLRLETVLKQAKIDNALSGAMPYRELAQTLDQTSIVKQCEQPHPTPPLALRPRKLSATEIETWIRDPYSIYAKHILKLRKLKDIEEDEDRRDWGTYVHYVLEVFTNQRHDIHQDNALSKLTEIAQDCLAQENLRPDQQKQWHLKFNNIAKWFIDFEKENTAVQKRLGERSGSIEIGNFRLTGRVDRLDISNENGISIIDYKTGTAPSIKSVTKGYSPQLPLMGLMAQKGGFKEATGHKIEHLSYYKFSGKQEKAGDITTINKNIDTLIFDTEKRLIDLINAFDTLETPYWSIPNFNVAPTYNDYEHLARIQEWSTGDDNGGDA